jgi:hypothetical protein
MELMEIIKSSLSIFSGISFVFILASYTIFKIKDRSRIKPYLRVNAQSANNNVIIQEPVKAEKLNVEKRNNAPLQMEANKIVVPQPAAPIQQRPLNADINFRPAKEFRLPQANERFRIVKPDTQVQENWWSTPEPILELSNKRIRLNNENRNIYEFYSDTNEKMHKLKLAVR